MSPRESGPRREIDWSLIRSRVSRAQAAAEHARGLSPERAKAILDERATALAHPAVPDQRVGEMLEIVTFSLANEHYGIETRFVREVVRLHDFTPIPGVPDFLMGLTNVRGDVVLVVDIRKLFGVSPRGLTDLSRLVVLGADRAEFGALADQVHEVTRLPAEELIEPPDGVTGIDRMYLRGMTRDALIVLHGLRLLGDRRLFIDQGRGQR